MNTAERIYQAAKELPEVDALEVLDFVDFLKAKRCRGLDETAYLLKAPANARDLLDAVRDLKQGRYQRHVLLPS